jgi:hypothetical protein
MTTEHQTDTLNYDEKVTVACHTCFRKYSVTVAQYEETYRKHGDRFYCSGTCIMGDFY